jgi:hypothetical protein
MKFISLPSGKIINLEQVAYIDAPGIYGDEKPEDGTLLVHFSAISFGQRGGPSAGGSLHCTLRGEDIKSFLNAMSEQGVKTDAILTEIGKKRN